MKNILFFILLALATILSAKTYETDTFSTSNGDLTITFLGHGSLMFNYDGKVIHVDPFGRVANYDSLPKADLILITHDHGDHLDPDAIKAIKKTTTKIILTQTCREKLGSGAVMKNGDKLDILGLAIEAVPAYNIKHVRSEGNPYHPKGQGNGYVVTFGDKRVYIAGDTENIPEMADLGNIDIAFIPMNLPYTMTPEMAADAARMIHPKILYPYHYGETDTSELLKLLQDDKDIEVRIRQLQ